MKRYESSLEQIDKVIERAARREGDKSKYYYHKVRILRRLNRPQEAMAVIDEVTEKYGNEDVFREKFDICCQFGLWEEAERILKDWHKNRKKEKQLKAAKIDLDLFTGKIDAARSALKAAAGKLNTYDEERLTLLLGELDGDEAVQMPIWEKRVKNRQDRTQIDRARKQLQRVLDEIEFDLT